MQLVGLEHLLALTDGTAFEGKMVLNDRGAVFGPVSTQHRELRADGIVYREEYRGDAVAAMLAPGKIEIRFHGAFSDETVTVWVRTLAQQASLGFLRAWKVTYQGRPLRVDVG